MICPKCQADDNRVIDTDKYDDNNERVRKCMKCHYIWTTFEVAKDKIVSLTPIPPI